ncbi:MAG: hypothetical protein AAFR35_03680 [Pseudomonadota bacterium]
MPLSGRVIAGVSIFLLVGMALGVQSVSMVLNWITPWRPERQLWGPITTVMLLLTASVVVGA